MDPLHCSVDAEIKEVIPQHGVDNTYVGISYLRVDENGIITDEPLRIKDYMPELIMRGHQMVSQRTKQQYYIYFLNKLKELRDKGICR